jgi:hypothetical protein
VPSRPALGPPRLATCYEQTGKWARRMDRANGEGSRRGITNSDQSAGVNELPIEGDTELALIGRADRLLTLFREQPNAGSDAGSDANVT